MRSFGVVQVAIGLALVSCNRDASQAGAAEQRDSALKTLGEAVAALDGAGEMFAMTSLGVGLDQRIPTGDRDSATTRSIVEDQLRGVDSLVHLVPERDMGSDVAALREDVEAWAVALREFLEADADTMPGSRGRAAADAIQQHADSAHARLARAGVGSDSAGSQ